MPQSEKIRQFVGHLAFGSNSRRCRALHKSGTGWFGKPFGDFFPLDSSPGQQSVMPGLSEVLWIATLWKYLRLFVLALFLVVFP